VSGNRAIGQSGKKADRKPLLLLGAVLVAWAVVLALILSHGIFVTNDSLSNYGHVWYVSERFWDGHGIPYHMPVLGHGEALAFPYSFLPWMTAALAYPVLGDWAVTLWLVLGFLALVAAVLWALPELRRPIPVALLLLNPAMIEVPLLGQLPFAWASAMLFVSVGLWRRERRLLAVIALGLAQLTHAPLLMPMAGLLLAACFVAHKQDRRQLVKFYGLSLVIALPAVWMVFASPVVDDTSFAVQMSNLVGTVLIRLPAVVWPFVLLAIVPRLRGAVPYALAGALVALNVAFVPVRHNDFGWEALLRRPDTSVRPFIRSDMFEKGKTYRILSSRDGKTPMYDLIRSGALLDSEFFPESINRRSFADSTEYVRFLNKRKVDYVIIYALYDTAHRTNEHALLDDLWDTVVDGVCTEHVAAVVDGEVLALGGKLVLREFWLDEPRYWVYRVKRDRC
jgi:hypothetical protein